MLISYWSDYACPYCYIGAACLKQAVKELQTEQKSLPSIHLVMKSFELDSNAPVHYTGSTTERFAQKYHLSCEAAAQRIASISKMGQNAGLSLCYEETRYTNTFDAHRLTKLAQNLGGIELAERISDRLYSAYFCDHLELADHKVLTRIAMEEGIPKKEIQELLSSDRFSDHVRQDELEADQRGIHAVPFFAVSQEISIPGALPPDQMKQILLRSLKQN